MKNTILILAGAGILSLCCATSYSYFTSGTAYAQTDTTITAAVTEATASFAVEKMSCATCPIAVKKAMKRVDGVKTVDIDFETKVATVVYDPSKTTPAQIAAASTGVGYPANEVTS